MTYLDLVNAVLRKLREDEVTVVEESNYSKLIGDFINDAINVVEAAWDWSSLRNIITVSVTSGTKTYALKDFNIRSELMSLYDTTSHNQIQQKSKAYIQDLHYRGTASSGKPWYFCFNGTDSNNDTQITLYPTPDASYTLEANVVLRNQSLVNDSDTTKLPTLPIIQYAFAYALRERGETGGQNAMEQLVIAQNDLANAIALDAGNNSGELVFDVI